MADAGSWQSCGEPQQMALEAHQPQLQATAAPQNDLACTRWCTTTDQIMRQQQEQADLKIKAAAVLSRPGQHLTGNI